MKSVSDQLARYLGAFLFVKGMPRAMKLGFIFGTVGSLTGVALYYFLRKR